MAITIKDLDKKVLSLEDVYRTLERTEPLADTVIDNESNIKFRLEPDWAMSYDGVEATEPVGAFMTINGAERAMTKEAVTQAAAHFGLSSSYISKKLPAPLFERLMNYHYGAGMGGESFNVLSVGDTVSAFAKPTIQPFSNIQLLDSVVEAIQGRHGKDAPIYADYKIGNSLLKTNIRLITPMTEREITSGGMDDVPNGQGDVWYAGVHLSNSLVGKTQTTLEAYLFRYWCTNGCTTTMRDVKPWNRKRDGQQDNVYEWPRDSVDEIMGDMEAQFDQVQSLTRLGTEGNTADVLRLIFDEYAVPISQQNPIQQRLLEQESLTMYKILNAITEVANDEELDDKRRDRLMRIGGAIPTETFDTIKAQVWEQGHKADKKARHPYEIRVAS